MVSSEDIKRRFLSYKNGSNRKKRCGCIETKIITLGSYVWVQDFELMCKKHRLDHKKEFDKAMGSRIFAEKTKKNKNKRRSKDSL